LNLHCIITINWWHIEKMLRDSMWTNFI